MSYPGGKGRESVYQTIINQIPPHSVYVEPFLGGASVMIAKRPAVLSIGVDKNQAALTSARAFFSDRLSRESSRSSSHVSGDAGSRGVSRSLSQLFNHFEDGGILSTHASVPEYRFKRRDALSFLRSIKVQRARPGECRAVEIDGVNVSRYPSWLPYFGVFIYLDPPYLVQSRKGLSAIYEHEFTDFQHIELLKLIRSLKGPMIAISGYRSDLYEELLKGWRVVTFKNVVRSGAVVTEYLWCNYPEPNELHDYSFIGRDFRERERIRRVQRNLLGKLRRLPPLERQALMIEALRLMGEL